MKRFPSPLGYKTVYATRRHWYEILPEVSDGIWWGTIITVTTFALIDKFSYPRLIALLLLNMYPLAHVIIELIKWNHEWFAVCRDTNGNGVFFKRHGLFVIKTTRDQIGHINAGLEDTSTWLGRRLGFARVQIRTATHSYIEGRLVPKELLVAINKVQVKAPEVPDDATGKQFVQGAVASWVDRDIVDEDVAKTVTRKWLLETVK